MEIPVIKLHLGLVLLSIFTVSTLFVSGAFAQDAMGEPGRDANKPNPLNNVYFGEQHLHSSASPDAFAFGRPARRSSARVHRCYVV